MTLVTLGTLSAILLALGWPATAGRVETVSLRRMDVELEAINSAFRDAVFAQCFQIIDAQSQDETDP